MRGLSDQIGDRRSYSASFRLVIRGLRNILSFQFFVVAATGKRTKNKPSVCTLRLARLADLDQEKNADLFGMTPER